MQSRMLILLLLVALQILLSTNLYADDPPAILWERTYEGIKVFFDVHGVSSGGIIAAGIDIYGNCLFRFDDSGNLLWSAGYGVFPWQGKSVAELPNGNFICTGSNYYFSGWDSDALNTALFIMEISSAGDTLWTRMYDFPDSWEEGLSIQPLPDGTMAICGNRNGSLPWAEGDAWVLKATSTGDTLWTRQWGWEYNDEARQVLIDDGNLAVLMHGRLESTSGGPHIVKYDSNGNLLSEEPVSDLYGEEGRDMCLSPTDDCYTMITYSGPKLCHVDDLGNLLWARGIPSASQPYGYSVNSTMDGGYIYGGQNTPDPDVPGSQYSGMIVKFDSDGQEMWRDYVYNSSCRAICSIRQLLQGGYIAAGNGEGQGLLIRYAPEVGIEEGSTLPSQVTLHQPLPNPFSSSLSVSYSLPESMQVSLSVYDISGRLVGDLENSVMNAGEHTSVWDPGEIPAGCYIVRLVTKQGIETRNCVLVR